MSKSTFSVRFSLIVILLFVSNIINAQNNFWQQTNGPYGDQVTKIISDFKGDLYINVNTDRTYKSSDGGDHWSMIINWGPLIGFDQNNNMYCPTGDRLLRSTDNGISWSFSDNGLQTTYFNINCWFCDQSGTLFLGTNKGIFKSTNNGDNWISKGLSNSSITTIASSVSGVIFCGTLGQYIYRSTNSGNNWEQTANGLTNPVIWAMAVDKINGYIYSGTNDGCFRTTNNGDEWIRVDSKFKSTKINSICNSLNGYLIVGSADGVYRTNDISKSWIRIDDNHLHSGVNTLLAHSSGLIYVGTEEGILRSSDEGASWKEINSGIYHRDICIAANSLGHIFVAGHLGIYRTTNEGNYWVLTDFPNYFIKSIAVSISDIIYVAYDNGMFRSSDNGDTWVQINDGLGNSEFNMIVCNNDEYIFAATTNGVYQSTNLGVDWKQINYIFGINNKCTYIAEANGDLLVATSDSKIYRSTNNGDLWASINNGPFANKNISTILRNSKGIIYVAANGFLYRSSDDGINWSDITDTLSTYELIINQSDFLIKCDWGSTVSCSSDNGDTWSNISSGLNNQQVNQLAFSPDGYLYATSNLGVFKSKSSTIPSGFPIRLKYLSQPVNSVVDLQLSNNPVVVIMDIANNIITQTSADVSIIIGNNPGGGLLKGSTVVSAKNGKATFTDLKIDKPGQGYTLIATSNNLQRAISNTFNIVQSNLLAPALLSPINGSIGVSLTPVLSWQSVNGAISYRLQIATDGNITSIILDDSNLLSTSIQMPALNNNVQYFWRVKAVNANGESDWSTVWNFTTVMNAPTAPTLLSPPDKATSVAINPTLTWNATPNATSYKIQLSISSSFTTTIIDQSGITQTSFSSNVLLDNTTYFWRVAATNSGGLSPWSSVWSFTTQLLPPAAPTLAFPLNDDTGIPVNTTLSWNAVRNASNYHLQVSTLQDFSSTFIDQQNISSSSQTVSGLVSNTKYYWRVNSTNSVGTGGWSSIWNFTTVYSGILPPTLATPTNNLKGVSVKPVISWNAINGAIEYRLMVSSSSSFEFNTIVQIRDIPAPMASYPWQGVPLSYNTAYYWKVNAKNANGVSDWSPVWNFTTEVATSLNDNNHSKPEGFNLFQNYPNPFSTSTTITFSIPRNEFVTINLYNVLGKVLCTLLSSDLSAGVHTINFNADDLPKGIYFYSVQAGKEQKFGQMAIVK